MIKESGNSVEVVGLAAQNRDLIAEAQRIAPQVERLSDPAGEANVVELLKPLMLMWPPKDIPEEDLARRAWWKIYRRALADIPFSALDKAVQDYIKTTRYKVFPAPGELRELADRHALELARVVARVKMLARRPLPKPPPSPEEKAKVAAEMMELMQNLKMRAAPADQHPRPRAERHAMAERLRAEADRLDKERAAGDTPAA